MVATTAPLHDSLDCGRRARAIRSYSRHQRAAAALERKAFRQRANPQLLILTNCTRILHVTRRRIDLLGFGNRFAPR
jgi:hypothetical protein